MEQLEVLMDLQVEEGNMLTSPYNELVSTKGTR